MIKFKNSKSELLITQSSFFSWLTVAVIPMAIIGVFILPILLQHRKEYYDSPAAYIFGIIFAFIWFGIIIFQFIRCLMLTSKKTIINSDGILCKTFAYQRFIAWSDVKDWGLSYCGQSKHMGNNYYLYFSDHECKIKNDCKKKLRGSMIKTIVIESDDYGAVLSTVIPFCSKKTDLKPFIGKNKFHFI